MARKIVVVFGLLVATLPYVGFPEAADTVMYTVFGLMTAFLAWSGRRHAAERPSGAPEEPRAAQPTSSEPRPSSTGGLERALPKERSEGHSSQETNGEDKNVSVSFAKRRSRNLKGRITQEPT